MTNCISCNKALILKAEENAWYKCTHCSYPLVCDRCNKGLAFPEGTIEKIRQHQIEEHYTSVNLV